MASSATRLLGVGLLAGVVALAAFAFWPRKEQPAQPESNAADLVLALEDRLLTAQKESNWTQFAEYIPPDGRQYWTPRIVVFGPAAGYLLESWRILEIKPEELPGPNGVQVEGYRVRVQCFGTQGEDRTAVVTGEFSDYWGPEEGGWYYQGRRP